MLIDAQGVEPGVYSLTIESFDSASSVQSALKTDTIEVTVKQSTQIQTDIYPLILISGQTQTWELHEILNTSDFEEAIV